MKILAVVVIQLNIKSVRKVHLDLSPLAFVLINVMIVMEKQGTIAYKLQFRTNNFANI